MMFIQFEADSIQFVPVVSRKITNNNKPLATDKSTVSLENN